MIYDFKSLVSRINTVFTLTDFTFFFSKHHTAVMNMPDNRTKCSPTKRLALEKYYLKKCEILFNKSLFVYQLMKHMLLLLLDQYKTIFNNTNRRQGNKANTFTIF